MLVASLNCNTCEDCYNCLVYLNCLMCLSCFSNTVVSCVSVAECVTCGVVVRFGIVSLRHFDKRFNGRNIQWLGLHVPSYFQNKTMVRGYDGCYPVAPTIHSLY